MGGAVHGRPGRAQGGWQAGEGCFGAANLTWPWPATQWGEAGSALDRGQRLADPPFP